MATTTSVLDAKLTGGAGKSAKIGMLIFGGALIVGFIYAGVRLASDLSEIHTTEIMPFVLLGVALLIALGFEFVNGFHDTANAVATVIYTHSMEPHMAVVWSGMWNLVGVLVSSGAVAFGIVSLLPVELILQVGSKARVCDGIRAADCGHHLEHGHVVVWVARVEFAHAGRFDHRRGHRQPVDVGKDGNQRRGLGPGNKHREVAAALAPGGIYRRGALCCFCARR